MPVNQYDNTTQSDGNAIDHATRVAAEQQNTNAAQEQAQAAQQTATPDPIEQMQRDAQDQQLRKQQRAGMSMSVW